MSRILAIDYGNQRCGVAVTDILKISINGLPTLPEKSLKDFLERYLNSEEVETIVLGWPTHKDGNPTPITKKIITLEEFLQKKFPHIELVRVDESYTSSEAKEILLLSNIKKKHRKVKELTDKVSAMLILERHLENL